MDTKTTKDLEAKIRRFTPVEITADVSKLSDGDKKALVKLFEASRILDRLYTRQVWSGNETLRSKLEADKTPEGALRLEYFNINMNPWSVLDHDAPFIEGAPPRPGGANFYPEDMTKEEFNAWVEKLPDAEKQKATGFFYTVHRDADRKLALVPFNEEYRDFLEPAAKLLHEAAALTTNASLKSFLSKRGDAFLSNDYYGSDVAWMDLDSPLEPTIGPYEVYMDDLFNYKAAFESFITLRNDGETNKLATFSKHLQDVENNLPINPKYRNPKLGASAPIRVVDEVLVGGEARAGVQTAAFNLPNDERITREKGSKRVMLRNVQEAKFKNVLVPIARIAVDASQQSKIAFEPFFTHILAHELMHGLGPHTIAVNGKQTTVRQQMKDLGSALEEAKADIAGLFALQYLIDKGVVAKSVEEPMYITYLAGTFRSVRFGINDAHGKGMVLQFNYLMDLGAIVYDAASGTFKVNIAAMKDASQRLTGDIMTIQAEGSYEKAKALFDKYVVIRPEMKAVLEKLSDVPTDIAPSFPLADQMK
ncbi:MAG: peptidase [Ignavibacteriales bacterium]|nr:peptidase [Ignavibacteriales bacterium]